MKIVSKGNWLLEKYKTLTFFLQNSEQGTKIPRTIAISSWSNH